MLAHANRFHGQASLRRFQKQCQTVRGPHFALKYAANTKRSQYRAAVVVSRKVSKSAVVRNRIRRRLYENVRILSKDLNGVYDIALVAYDEHLATLPAAQLSQELTKVFRAAKLLSADTPGHAIVEAQRKT